MKKHLSLLLTFILIANIVTPASAINMEDGEGQVGLNETSVCSEYEMVLKQMQSENVPYSINDQSNPISKYIHTISERATLPVETLQEYGYSDKQINLLKKYNDGTLTFEQIAYATSANLTTTLTAPNHTSSVYTVVYSWSWDVLPSGTGEDSAALVLMGVNNNSAGIQTEFLATAANVYYYYSDGSQYKVESPTVSVKDSGASTKFIIYKQDDVQSRWVWAKKGSITAQIKPVSSSSSFVAVKARGEFAHTGPSTNARIQSIEFSADFKNMKFSVKFTLTPDSTGSVTVMGAKQYVFHNDGSVVKEQS